MKITFNGTHTMEARSFDSSRHKRLGISEEMEGMITQLLTHFYQNPEYATARELIVNALEACREAGVPAQVFVTLTDGITATNEVIFTDHGIGMTQEIFEDIFAAYGESTKRDSDEQTGGFGLGCKTPYTMSDTFTVITQRDGRKMLGIFTRDEEEFGNADFKDLGETDEQGTIITIPLARESVPKMRKAIERVAYVLPPETVYINGDPCASMSSEMFEIGDHACAIDHPVDFLSKWNVLMGGILYPLDNIEFAPTRENGRSIYGRSPSHVIFKARVDEFSPTPQRDQLRDIRSNREHLKERYDALREFLPEYMNSYLSQNYEHSGAVRAAGKYNLWFKQIMGSPIMALCTWNGMSLRNELTLSDKTLYEKKYRRPLSDTNTLRMNYIEDGLVIAYEGLDARNMNDRKFILDYNRRAREHDGTIQFIFLDEGEVYRKDWFIAGGDESLVTVITRDEVYATRPRTSRSRPANPITYDVVKFAGGVQTVETCAVEDIGDDTLIVNDFDKAVLASRFIPQWFEGKKIVRLRPNQHLAVLQRRCPDLVNCTDEYIQEMDRYVEDALSDQVLQDRAQAQCKQRRLSSTLHVIADRLPESAYARLLRDWYADNDSRYSSRSRASVRDDVFYNLQQAVHYFPNVRKKMEKYDHIVKEADVFRRYPLLQSVTYTAQGEHLLPHAVTYIKAVESN